MRRNEGESEEIGNLILELNCKNKKKVPHQCNKKVQFKTPTCIHSKQWRDIPTFYDTNFSFLLNLMLVRKNLCTLLVLSLFMHIWKQKQEIKKRTFVCFKKVCWMCFSLLYNFPNEATKYSHSVECSYRSKTFFFSTQMVFNVFNCSVSLFMVNFLEQTSVRMSSLVTR